MEADFGKGAFDPGPAQGKSCDGRRWCEDALECDSIESESSRGVPNEKRVDIFFALLFAIVAAVWRLMLWSRICFTVVEDWVR